MSTVSQLSTNEQGFDVDNTTHDLIHALSVRLDAKWHDKSYSEETGCDSCRTAFERLRSLDQTAIQLLSAELERHIRTRGFPVEIAE